jgi:hypothetical protein
MDTFPFTEQKLNNNESIRTFKSTAKNDELKWHRDYHDRIIQVLNENDWQIQFDNCLPVPLLKEFSIKKGVYHRLIKGTTDLIVKITEKQ